MSDTRAVDLPTTVARTMPAPCKRNSLILLSCTDATMGAGVEIPSFVSKSQQEILLWNQVVAVACRESDSPFPACPVPACSRGILLLFCNTPSFHVRIEKVNKHSFHSIPLCACCASCAVCSFVAAYSSIPSPPRPICIFLYLSLSLDFISSKFKVGGKYIRQSILLVTQVGRHPEMEGGGGCTRTHGHRLFC